MSSRQQEKEKRRQERLALEQAEAARARRRRRLQLVIGGLLAAAALAAVAVAVGSGGGDDSGPRSSSSPGVKLPAQRIADLDDAAKAAGCVVRTFPVEGQSPPAHVPKVRYKTNPPTSGDHHDVPAEDGIYDPGNEPAKEHLVHSLEHGRILLQYRPGTPPSQIRQLEAVFNEEHNGISGYHMLLFQNNTNMPYAVAATAWTHLLGCRTFNPRIFDAIRAFRARYTDKGPEFVA